MSTWSEATLELRSSNRNNTSASQENQGVTLAWNNRIAGADTAQHGPAAHYVVELPEGLAADMRLWSGSTLDFMLAPTNRVPGPRKASEAGDENETNENEDEERPSRPSRTGDDEEDSPVDLSVELTDASGESARVTLSDYGAIRRPLETYVMRRRDLERQRFQSHWELILQTFSIPLRDFVADNRNLDLRQLRSVGLVFDRVHGGEVVVDHIGFTPDMDPAFLRARVDGW